MANPILDLPILWSATQGFEIAHDLMALGDDYSQLIIRGTVPLSFRWEVTSPILTQSSADAILQNLRDFQGETVFQWRAVSSDSFQTYTCEQWRLTLVGVNAYQISGTLVYDPSGQCLAYANLINETDLTAKLEGAIEYFSRFTRSQKPFVINLQGVSVNNFHDVLGRGGYLPEGAGTTEGQSAIIRSLLVARKIAALSATAKSQALTAANLLASALEPYFYRGNTVPTNPTAGIWLPHWIVNARDAFPSKGAVAAKPENYGYFQVPVTFTSGVGTIPTINGGSLVGDVHSVGSSDSKLLWRNVYAPIVQGTQFTINYWVSNLVLRGQNYRFSPDYQQPGAAAPTPTSETAGKIVLGGAQSNFTGTALVTYSGYVGPTININDPFEAWPMWRQLATGEIRAAFDACWWLYDAYIELAAATGLSKWTRAANATKYSAIQTSIVQNESYLFKKDITTTEPFSYAGTQLVVVNNSAGSSAARASDGGVIATIGNGSELYPSAELQNFAIAIGMQIGVTMLVELAASVVCLLEISVSLSKNPLDLTKTYTFYQPMSAAISTYTTRAILPQEFLQWGNNTLWHPTNSDSPVYIYSGGGGGVTVVRELQAIDTFSRLVNRIQLSRGGGFAGAGFVLFNAKNTPPTIYYKKSGDRVNYRVQDGAGVFYSWELPSTGGAWAQFTPTWDSTAAAVVQAVDLQIAGNNAEVSVWWVGAGPVILPYPCYCYKTSITSRVDTAHQFKVGTIQATNSPLNFLKGSPGAVPFTVNIIGGAIESWRGSMYLGYQSPVSWLDWGESVRYNQVLDLMIEAQDAYAKQSTSGDIGPFAPVYLWPLWSEGVYGDYNTWTWTGPDPNTEWVGYQIRPLLSAARAWYKDRGNIKAKTIVMRFLGFLDKTYRRNNSAQPPTNFPAQVAPQVRYHEPHAAAMIAESALWANLAGGTPGITFRVLKRSLDYLNGQYINSGNMAGSFAASQPTFTGADSLIYQEYFGFWHAEIIQAIAKIIENKAAIILPPCSVVV